MIPLYTRMNAHHHASMYAINGEFRPLFDSMSYKHSQEVARVNLLDEMFQSPIRDENLSQQFLASISQSSSDSEFSISFTDSSSASHEGNSTGRSGSDSDHSVQQPVPFVHRDSSDELVVTSSSQFSSNQAIVSLQSSFFNSS